MMHYPEFETGVAEPMAGNPAIYLDGWKALARSPHGKPRQSLRISDQESCREGVNPFRGMIIALMLAIPFWMGVGVLLLK